MEPKHVAPITRVTGVNDASEVAERLALVPGPTFTVIHATGQRHQGFRDQSGAGWVITHGSHLPQPLAEIDPPYLLSYPIAPEATAEDSLTVCVGVLRTEHERDTYNQKFIESDGEQHNAHQALAVDAHGGHWRLRINWETHLIVADIIHTVPGAGGGGSHDFTELLLPVTVVELD